MNTWLEPNSNNTKLREKDIKWKHSDVWDSRYDDTYTDTSDEYCCCCFFIRNKKSNLDINLYDIHNHEPPRVNKIRNLLGK